MRPAGPSFALGRLLVGMLALCVCVCACAHYAGAIWCWSGGEWGQDLTRRWAAMQRPGASDQGRAAGARGPPPALYHCFTPVPPLLGQPKQRRSGLSGALDCCYTANLHGLHAQQAAAPLCYPSSVFGKRLTPLGKSEPHNTQGTHTHNTIGINAP